MLRAAPKTPLSKPGKPCCPATPRQVADIERRTRRTLALLDIYIGVLASLARRADPGLPVETVTVTGGLL